MSEIKLNLRSWIGGALEGSGAAKSSKAKQNEFVGSVLIFSSWQSLRDSRSVKEIAAEWKMNQIHSQEQVKYRFTGERGPIWILCMPELKSGHHAGFLDINEYSWARDQVGVIVSEIISENLNSLEVNFEGNISRDCLRGALVGLEIGQYRYKQIGALPKLTLINNKKGLDKKTIDQALYQAEAVNIARHLVNLPANELNPESYAKAVQGLFRKSKTAKVEVLDSVRLKKEKTGLILAVGEGAVSQPRVVHIKYRPPGAKGKPLAFVGKGVTFDSGGLNLKPSNSMRLMKKDMGGSAALVGLAYWAEKARIKKPFDVYLGLVENSVDQKSFRPGDVLTAANGLTVEIDNTDAEGRLVLADTLHLATSKKGADAPSVVIDVATLTGAGKIGLGKAISGLFSTSDKLSAELMDAGVRSGDRCWRMPLYEPYFSAFETPFADFVNSAPGGWGGSITAALFLSRFTNDIPWAHFDIYAWADSPEGAIAEIGGNGQSVQRLIAYMSN